MRVQPGRGRPRRACAGTVRVIPGHDVGGGETRHSRDTAKFVVNSRYVVFLSVVVASRKFCLTSTSLGVQLILGLCATICRDYFCTITGHDRPYRGDIRQHQCFDPC